MSIKKGKDTAGTLEVDITSGGTSIVGEDNVARYRVLVLRSALRLEVAGMRHSGGSVYALVKKEFGFKGNKAKVLAQLDQWVAANIRTPNQE